MAEKNILRDGDGKKTKIKADDYLVFYRQLGHIAASFRRPYGQLLIDERDELPLSGSNAFLSLAKLISALTGLSYEQTEVLGGHYAVKFIKTG